MPRVGGLAEGGLARDAGRCRPAVSLSLSRYRDLPSAQLLLGSRCEQLSGKG
jgi:hypothetical protein